LNQEVFGLKCDFIYRQGHYMELYQDDGIAPEQLSALQLRMLEANQVPHLLPLEVRELDNRLSLLYKLSPRRMLNQVLKSEKLSQQNFAKLFYAIINALEESQHYMLHQDGYVMKESFIFLGTDWSDVYLTYIPLAQIDEGGGQPEAFGLLMERIADKVRDEDRPQVKDWVEDMSRIHDHALLKQKLLMQMQQKQTISKNLMEIRNEHTNEHALKAQQIAESPSLNRGLPKPVLNQQPKLDRMPSAAAIADNAEEAASIIQLSSKTQLIVAAVCFLLASFVWHKYLSAPADAALRFTVGVTMLFADICFVAKFIGLPQMKKKQNIKQAATSKQEPLLEQKMQQSAANQQSVEDYYRNLHLYTTLLIKTDEPDQTVYLGLNHHVKREPEIVLEYMEEGQSQSVSIITNKFTIGRGETGNLDLVIDVPGVSRKHAEINQLDGNFELIDLGSTNGTAVNEQALAAHKPYSLQNGDVIRIASVRLTFRIL